MTCPIKEFRWRRRKEARPAELTAAALEVFVEKGFAATRLDEIAARAGVSKGTVYLYFSSKEELFKAVVRESVVPRIAEAEKLLESATGSAVELLREIMLGWWQVIGSTTLGGIPKLMIAESRNFPELARFYHDEVIQRATRLVETLLERGIAAGEFRRFNIKAAVHISFSPLLMRAVWDHSLACCESEHVPPDIYIAEAVEFILRGLRANP
jgi:AcrR family transcriptional regulator